MFDQTTIKKLNGKARKAKKAAQHGASPREMRHLLNDLASARKDAMAK